MTQASPTVLLYEQAAVLVNEILTEFRSGSLQTIEELSERLRDTLTRYQTTAGRPLMEFEALADGEPPLSAKMNRFWDAAKHDVNILQRQVDLLRASSIFVHNSIAAEVVRSRQENAKVRNKLATLQLYSTSADSSVIVFNENFGSTQFFDLDLVPSGERALILENAFLSLGRQAALVDLSQDATARVLETSNGFAGNNQEIRDPATAPVNPADGSRVYSFVGETARAADLTQVLDGEPNTWFEYEHVWISPSDRLTAGNLNFEYAKVDATSRTEVDWAKGPVGDVLKLDLEVDLQAVQKVNYLTYTPYGLESNANYPVRVNLIQTSVDGTNWQPVSPQKVYVGSAMNLQTARSAANVAIGTAVWSFQERDVRYLRLSLEQPQYMSRPIGHLYYLDKTSTQRVEGPLPTIDNPTLEYLPGRSVSSNTIQRREYFSGRRWAIGIRDIAIQQVEYYEHSAMISESIRAGGIIDRVTLDADIYIPPEFPSSTAYVRFYISPDNGNTWVPISRVTDDYLGLPEILAFNDPTPEAFRESGVQYVNVDGVVESVRVKIELQRPTDQEGSTPLVRNYTVRMKKR